MTAAHADAQRWAGRGLEPASPDRLDDKLLDPPRTPSANRSIWMRLMFSLPEALGGDGDGYSRHRPPDAPVMAAGVLSPVLPRRVIPGHDTLAQIAVGVAPPYALMDRSLEAAVDMDVRTQLHEGLEAVPVSDEWADPLLSPPRGSIEQVEECSLPAAGALRPRALSSASWSGASRCCRCRGGPRYL